MAVTTPGVDARVALALSSLHAITHPDAGVDHWLDFVVTDVARDNAPGTVVELPTGDRWLRLVLVVPDPTSTDAAPPYSGLGAETGGQG
jgi:GAF domain-containing protein